MASAAAAADGTNERAAEATARRTGGLLAVRGVQPQTIGHELAWGRTSTEVGSIFYFQHFNFCIIYFLQLFIY